MAQIPVPTPLRQPYNHTATISAFPDGSLLVAWTAGARELATDTAIYVTRREAAGRWSEPSIVADTPGRPDANCVLFLDDRQTLHLYYVSVFGTTFCEGIVLQRVSDDDGLTWSEPRPLMPAVCTMVKNKPLILASGRWLLPAYIEGVYMSQFWFSDDRGRTWLPTPPLLTLPNNLQPAIAQRSDGSILAFMRRGDGDDFTWQGVSCDGGFFWNLSPRQDLFNPNSGLDLLKHSSGLFVMAYNDSATQRSPLVARASIDEGRTWLPPRTLAEGDGQYSYPTLAESPDGHIHIVYSEKLEAIAHAEFNPAWLLSSEP